MRTRPDGTFSLDLLTPGAWRVELTDHEFVEGGSATSFSSGIFAAPYSSIDPNCVVREGQITWFDLAAGAARAGATIQGRFEPDGLSPDRFQVRLVAQDPAASPESRRSTVRVAPDGSFVAESPNTGAHSLLIEEILDPTEDTRLRFFLPLELAAGERELTLRIPSGSVVTGHTANPTRHRLMWRGPDGIVAFSGLASLGESRWFPAGDVSLVPLESVVFGIPPASAALDQIDLAVGATESIGQ